MTEYQDSGDRLFQWMDAATVNERQPTVARRYAGTCNRCDEDERRPVMGKSQIKSQVQITNHLQK